ncbi:MAG: ribosome silencing factor [Deltaproteobacteria bacterium]|nr:ribosome silencing factor [Deltaproteobacteria bacterium]
MKKDIKKFLNPKEKSLECIKAALDKKAFDIVLLDVKKLVDYTEYFLIVSGRSDRQVKAIGESIIETMKKKNEKPLGVEGMSEGRWVLIDLDEVIVHIFFYPIREFYDLENLWIEAPKIDLSGIEVKTEKKRQPGI